MTMLLMATPVAFAGNTINFNDYATVISSQPSYHTTEPREECTERYETPAQPQVKQNNTAGKLVGGLLGAAVGSKIGKGSGNKIATVVGGLAGYEAGGAYLGGNPNPEPIRVRTCRTIPGESRISGYNLVVDFNGKTMNVTYPSPVNNGQTIPVNVSVSATGGAPVYQEREYRSNSNSQQNW